MMRAGPRVDFSRTHPHGTVNCKLQCGSFSLKIWSAHRHSSQTQSPGCDRGVQFVSKRVCSGNGDLYRTQFGKLEHPRQLEHESSYPTE